MILADTSVWVDHIRSPSERLSELLQESQVLMHPFIIGEIACGSMRARERVLEFLNDLPVAVLADHREALVLLNDHRLWGTGLSWIDIHLLTSTLLTGCELWTIDQRLHKAAHSLKVAYRNRPWIS